MVAWRSLRAGALVAMAAVAMVPMAPLDPTPEYCYSTGQWLPWPDISGYCPDGQAPHGVGPDYGQGNHRWPDGSDD
jgi:hypothetical protein